jgi:hypothetical protein
MTTGRINQVAIPRANTHDKPPYATTTLNSAIHEQQLSHRYINYNRPMLPTYQRRWNVTNNNHQNQYKHRNYTNHYLITPHKPTHCLQQVEVQVQVLLDTHNSPHRQYVALDTLVRTSIFQSPTHASSCITGYLEDTSTRTTANQRQQGLFIVKQAKRYHLRKRETDNFHTPKTGTCAAAVKTTNMRPTTANQNAPPCDAATAAHAQDNRYCHRPQQHGKSNCRPCNKQTTDRRTTNTLLCYQTQPNTTLAPRFTHTTTNTTTTQQHQQQATHNHTPRVTFQKQTRAAGGCGPTKASTNTHNSLLPPQNTYPCSAPHVTVNVQGCRGAGATAVLLRGPGPHRQLCTAGQGPDGRTGRDKHTSCFPPFPPQLQT